MIELMSQGTAQLAGFGQDFLTGRGAEHQDQFLMVKRTQTGKIILMVDQDHRVVGGFYCLNWRNKEKNLAPRWEGLSQCATREDRPAQSGT